MNTRISLLVSLAVWLLAVTAWSQDVPPPPPEPEMPAPAPYVAPAPYAAPVAVTPRPVMVLVQAPPLPKYTWSVNADVLFLERSSGGSIPLGYTLSSSPHSGDALYSDDALFPLSAGLRLEATRQLNSNWSVLATYWGLQQWSAGSTIYGNPYDNSVLAFSPHMPLSGLIPGFNDSLGYTSTSRIENAELGALFRLSTSDYWKLDWLWGARYVYFSDRLTLTGVDDDYSAVEQLEYSTTNSLAGVQTGLLFSHGWNRFAWEAGLKFGLMANFYRQRGTDTAASDPTGQFIPYDISNKGSDFSALFEFSLFACYRLTDNLWFRLGYQVYDITGLALAPRQLTDWGHGGNVAFDGLALGLKATW
jgi:hypothetical protein